MRLDYVTLASMDGMNIDWVIGHVQPRPKPDFNDGSCQAAADARTDYSVLGRKHGGNHAASCQSRGRTKRTASPTRIIPGRSTDALSASLPSKR